MIQSNDAIAPLIRILQTLSRDEELWDWVGEDLPHYFVYLGAPALPELSKLLADVSQTDYARENAITAITGIYKRYPETRTDCINALTKQLAHFTKNNPDLNARLVTDLTTDFKATETVELIEQAFQSGRVNRPIHKFVSQAVQRLQRISLRLFQVERIYLGRRNQGLSIVPISN